MEPAPPSLHPDRPASTLTSRTCVCQQLCPLSRPRAEEESQSRRRRVSPDHSDQSKGPGDMATSQAHARQPAGPVQAFRRRGQLGVSGEDSGLCSPERRQSLCWKPGAHGVSPGRDGRLIRCSTSKIKHNIRLVVQDKGVTYFGNDVYRLAISTRNYLVRCTHVTRIQSSPRQMRTHTCRGRSSAVCTVKI